MEDSREQMRFSPESFTVPGGSLRIQVCEMHIKPQANISQTATVAASTADLEPCGTSPPSPPPPSPPPLPPPSPLPPSWPPPSPPPAAPGPLELELNAGWTWVSFNRVADDMSVSTVLASVSASAGDTVRAQTSFTNYYDGFGWFGQLTTMPLDSMYKVQLTTAQSFQFYGQVPVPLPYQFRFDGVWNWMAYLRQGVEALPTGMPDFPYTHGDQVKSQYEFADYYDGFGWFGSLTRLTPGDGYKVKLSTTGVATYRPLQTRRRLESPNHREEQQWRWRRQQQQQRPPAVRFESSMAITALVFVDGVLQTNGTLTAKAPGGEARGSIEPSPVPFGPHRGKYLFSFLVYSDVNGEELSFAFDGSVRAMSDTAAIFSVDATLGNAIDPLVLNVAPPTAPSVAQCSLRPDQASRRCRCAFNGESPGDPILTCGAPPSHARRAHGTTYDMPVDSARDAPTV